jgi:ribonuclease R
LMRDQVGQQFPGTVSAVTSFGAFVELDEPFVEGLIKLDSLGEPMSYDNVHMRLSGERSGRSIELGDKVTVEINNVSVVRRRIDFTLITGAAREPSKPASAKLETNPRASFKQKRAAGREVERAQRPRASSTGDGKVRFGVSHRGLKTSKSKKKR